MSQISAGGNFLACRIYIGNSAGGVTPVFTCNYITEDGLSAYVAEDGTTFYVPETCPSDPFGPAFNMIPSVLNQGGGQFRII